jgi:arylsulfatase A
MERSRRELFRSVTANRRTVLKAAVTGVALALSAEAQQGRPNIILINCDDLGYGDLGSHGSCIKTPNLNQMARDGVRFTNFTSASPVCSPSRAALMTGRYPNRYGVPRVINPGENVGIPDSETTVAQMLRAAGYSTMCIGKWHLGDLPQFLPTSRGFQNFYGIPYSADMSPLPLMRDQTVIEQPANVQTLTQRYTQTAVDYINSSTSPFFLYMAHSTPHVPLMPSTPFAGQSGEGLYGDVVSEIDSSVGQILQALRTKGIDSNTLVMFTSDHGPWYQGSTGGLRGRKGEVFEGGVRIPLIARYPGVIPLGQVCTSLTSNLDILPTLATLSGAALPPNPVDGVDITPLLRGFQTSVARDALLYFNDVELQAARLGDWKLHVTRFNTPAFTPDPAGGRVNLPLPHPELYNVTNDLDESHDRAARNMDVVASIRSRMDQLILTFPSGINDAWTDTLSHRVQNTAAGALPIEITT